MRLAPLTVFALALAVRAAAAAAIVFPIPEGSAYYVAAGQSLASGRGLDIDLLWSYATPPLALPRPAFDLWQPLAAVLAAPFDLLLPPLRGAQVVSVLLGALAAPLAWAIGARSATELGLPPVRAASVALMAGVLVALTPLLVVQGAEPDSSAPFAFLALAACWLMPPALVERGPSWRRRAALGVAIGLAYLARQEAVYLALAYVVLAWWDGRQSGSGRGGIRRAVLALGVAAVIVAPWLARQALTWEASPLGQVLENAWWVQQTDLVAWSARPTLASHLALGAGGLATLRLDAIAGAVALILLAAFPAGVLGLAAWAARPRLVLVPSLRPLAIVAAVTFVVDVVVFPVASRAGLWSHGNGPAIALLAVVGALGLDRSVAWLAALRGWRPAPSITGRLALLGPIVAAVLSLPLAGLAATLEHERAVLVQAQYRALAASAARWDVPPGPVVTDHPMWLNAALERPALALPRESPAAIVSLARHFTAAAVVARDPDATAILSVLAAHTEGGVPCFRELPVPAPFRALAFTCPTELASPVRESPVTIGTAGDGPYTGLEAWYP